MNQTSTSMVDTLLDFSFSSFVTARFIRILYIIVWLLAALGGFLVFLGMLIGGFSQGVLSGLAMGLLGLVMGAFVFALNLIFGRIALEILIVLFRIAENTQALADRA